MGAYIDLRKGAVVLRFAMMGALGNGAADAFICVHAFSPHFLWFQFYCLPDGAFYTVKNNCCFDISGSSFSFKLQWMKAIFSNTASIAL